MFKRTYAELQTPAMTLIQSSMAHKHVSSTSTHHEDHIHKIIF